MKDLFIVSYEILPPFSRQNDNHCECIINCETPYSHVCMGGYSYLPSANLLSLGIIQVRLSSALAESQLCLCSLSCGVSIVIRFIHNFQALRIFHIHRPDDLFTFTGFTAYVVKFRPVGALWFWLFTYSQA